MPVPPIIPDPSKETPESSVGNLCIALGWCYFDLSPEQRQCFADSVACLAKAAGVSDDIIERSFQT